MASIQHRRAERYGLEVMALGGAWQDISDPPSEAEIETSKAISAKRQADALERIANQLDGTAKGATVYDFIGYIADAARNG